MCLSKTEGKMEGWLYTIRHNRIGLQFSRKRYFVLRDNSLLSYKSIPSAVDEEPDRRASLDSCIRVTDNGRESFNRKVLFIFTLYNTSNHLDQLKLGASSSEDAAKWIRSLQDASLKGSPIPDCEFVSHSMRGLVRLDVSKRSRRKNSVDWTYSSVNAEEKTSDVIAPSPWKIFGCQNGLRLFKEAKDWDSRGRHWDDHPAIMAVGIIDATSEDIFHSLMSLGPLRSEWDFSFYKGNMVEHLDGHTDIIHFQLYNDWLPWGMKRRDLLLRRYWRREDDGTYVILCHSVYHKKCPRRRGYVRACLKSGGYVVSPINNGKQSLVKHMLAIDWRCWNLYMRPSSARSITIRMVARVAALREMFKAKQGHSFSVFSSGELMGIKSLSKIKTRSVTPEAKELEEIVKTEVGMDTTREEADKPSSARASLMDLNDASDEFFDVLEPKELTGFDSSDSECHSPGEIGLQGHTQLKLPSAVGLVKKLQDLAVQKKGYTDLQEVAAEEKPRYFYGATLQKDTTLTLPCSWATADASTFLIRGKDYLKNHQKEKAKGTLTQMIGADWIRSDNREDDLGGRLGGIVQESAAEGRPAFFFIVNIQVPGSSMYSLALYYTLKTPLEENPLLHSFVNGDDAYRNSRFKLIPHISKGSWIVKQSVGKKACLVGQALDVRYFRGKNYLELDVDVGSSTVARGVTNLVLGYLNNLVIEMAFLIQANTEDELPEALLGTCRLNYLDVLKSVQEK